MSYPNPGKVTSLAEHAGEVAKRPSGTMLSIAPRSGFVEVVAQVCDELRISRVIR